MKNLIIIILAVFTIGSFSSCISTAPSASKDSAVRTFLQKYNKEEFLLDIEKQRAICNKLVLKLKAKGYEDKDVNDTYYKTQEKYNNILDQMIKDIKKVKTIVGFKLFDADARYANELIDAKAAGDRFILEASKKLGDNALGVTPLLSFTMNKLWPMLKNVHDRYMDYAKLKMESRINEAKFEWWGNIE